MHSPYVLHSVAAKPFHQEQTHKLNSLFFLKFAEDQKNGSSYMEILGEMHNTLTARTLLAVFGHLDVCCTSSV